MSGAYRASELRDIINGKRSFERIPRAVKFWGDVVDLHSMNKAAADVLEGRQDDVNFIELNMPKAVPGEGGQAWLNAGAGEIDGKKGLDNRCVLEDYARLDEILAKFPSPEYPELIPKNTVKDERYAVAYWWYGFFERQWELRGMVNALQDFYLEEENTVRLLDAIADFYVRAAERARDELGCDALFFSDDMGTQNGPFFSPAIFDKFFAPCYKKVVDAVHARGMQFWLHSCGNIEAFIPRFIELGVDVLHPIQKHTMNRAEIAARFGGRICFWGGFDVQRAIPFGSPEDIRGEFGELMSTLGAGGTRFIMGMGNALGKDSRPGNLKELYEYLDGIAEGTAK